MKNFLFVASTLLVLTNPALAQNLIQDGGFDGASQTSFGNKGPKEIQPWYFWQGQSLQCDFEQS
jgi:hypothetical protein